MKPTRVTIVDYGVGNLFSVSRAFEQCGAEVILSSDADVIEQSERLVLPGVGAFADGMQGLRERGLIEPIRRYAASGKPLLGICLGMQMLASFSEEFGNHRGLDLIPGRVVPLPKPGPGEKQKIPHIGWVGIRSPQSDRWEGSLLATSEQDAFVYLVHSFHVVPDNATHSLAVCDYGDGEMVAALRAENIQGCQFHPEKSGPAGLRMLDAFLRTPGER